MMQAVAHDVPRVKCTPAASVRRPAPVRPPAVAASVAHELDRMSDRRMPAEPATHAPVMVRRSISGPKPSSSRPERSVVMDGEEEQTTNGGSSPASPAGGLVSAASCDCTPTRIAIANVSPYRRGDLYGHDFDVVIDLTYTQATTLGGMDAELVWLERTDRPPAWQGLAANTWNDMFARFPTSPTFHGWTRNRTKPCEGSETATIHDPPGASVQMPARTLEFAISVRASGTLPLTATARQVLEPDGAGGVKTQTFSV